MKQTLLNHIDILPALVLFTLLCVGAYAMGKSF